jgi:hypothetical protein
LDEIRQDNPRAASPTFASADSRSKMAAKVQAAPSVADAAKLVALAEGPDTPDCYGRAFKEMFTRQQAGNRAVPAELAD